MVVIEKVFLGVAFPTDHLLEECGDGLKLEHSATTENSHVIVDGVDILTFEFQFLGSVENLALFVVAWWCDPAIALELDDDRPMIHRR